MILGISIVVYNENEVSFKNCIKLCKEIKSPKKIFVYDNSPNSNLRVLAEKYKVTSYTHNKRNIGFGAGHNKNFNLSIKENCGAFLILNCDALNFSTTISKMIQLLTNNSDVDGLVPIILDDHNKITDNVRLVMNFHNFLIRIVKFLITGKRVLREIQKIYETKSSKSKLIKIPCAAGCFLLVRSSIFKNIGGFDENFFLYCEDLDLTRRISNFRQGLYLDLNSKINHHGRRSSHSNQKLFFIHIHSLIRYFKKWGIIDLEARKTNMKWINYIKRFSS